MNLILQPCSNKLAYDHFEKTVANKSLNLSKIEKHLNERDRNLLLNIYGTNAVSVWGITPPLFSKWDRIEIGDLVLFSGKGQIFAYGIVCHKTNNKNLSQYLWGSDENNNAWEYLYFLQEVTLISIPYSNFNKAMGYKENYIIQGFNVLSKDKTDNFLNTYPLESLTFVENVMENEYYDIVSNPLTTLDSVDGKILSIQRKEQAFLRRQLFKGKITAKCSICGEEFPVSLLCCSHIKKRCYCTLEEKKDYRNIVTPMCSLGCDKLFENGYIAVDNGKVKVLKLTNIKTLDNKIRALENKPVLGYSESNKKYYQAHLIQNLKK